MRNLKYLFIAIVTLGLSTFIISALLLWFVSTFVDGFTVESFNAALLAAVIILLVSFVTNGLLKAKR